MSDPGFFAELKRRNVLRVAAFYGGTGWLLIQVVNLVVPLFNIPPGALRIMVIVVLAGFIPAVLFAWFFELTPHGIRRENEIAPGESITRLTGRQLNRWIIGVLGLAVGFLLLNQFVLHRFVTGAAPKITPVAGATQKSIAVLPLANSTGDPANEYFSDGVSEELISSLSRLSDLKVIGRTSSFQFKGKTDDSKSIGEKLGVVYLLEGSVRKSSDRVRIAVALVQSADGANVWADTYDRELKDIFAVQSEIAGAVAGQLKVALLGNTAQAAATTTAPQNLDAYNALLQGNFFDERETLEDSRTAIGYYQDAVRLDPNYGLAWARLSIAAGKLAGSFTGLASAEGQQAVALAHSAADTALRLAPDLADAHLARGSVLQGFDFKFTAAEAELRRGLALAPQNPDLIRRLAILIACLGRIDEGAAFLEPAIALDPLRNASHYTLGVLYMTQGRYERAEAALRKSIDLQPKSAQSHAYLAVLQILRGQPATALALARQEPDAFWRDYGVQLATFASGDRAAADTTLAQFIAAYADDSGVQIASIYALRREPEKMYEWLDHAWATQDPGVTQILWDPLFQPYVKESRFVAFAKKVGLMQ